MKLCDYCGFVIKDNDVKCFNCRMAIPGREVSESVVKAAEVQKNVQLAHSTRSLSSYVPKKLIALILVVGLFASPQTQMLLGDGIYYWDEINTPYYTIPEKIVLTYVRNFEIYVEEGNDV